MVEGRGVEEELGGHAQQVRELGLPKAKASGPELEGMPLGLLLLESGLEA